MEDAGGIASIIRDGWIDWEVLGKSVCVRITSDVAARLGMAVREGFKALPRRGLETGGLLIGSRRSGDPAVVEIDDFEAIESEHAAGPAYLLSEVDRRLLETRIRAREAGGKSAGIVGFYRSHTRHDFAITKEDAALFSAYFRNSSDVFLLIKPNEGGPPLGGFVIREEGKIVSDSPYLQFPLAGTVGVPAVHEQPPEPVQELPPAPRRAVQIVQSAPLRPPSWKARACVWAVAAAVTALSTGLFFAIPGRVPGLPPGKPRPSPALSVTNIGNSLRLSWDHQVSREGGHAVLWIHDGQETQRLELDEKQLSEGSVVYWPSHSDVDFRLELLTPGGSVTESIRAIGGPAKVASGNPVQAAVVKPHSLTPVRRSRIVAAPRQSPRTLTLPRRNPSSSAAASIPDGPAVQREVEASAGRKQFLDSLVADRSAENEVPGVQVRAEPVTGHRNIPLLGRLGRRTDYVPPSVVRGPAPLNLAHRKMLRDVQVNIKVYVNASGKVDYAEVISKVAEADRDLASLAVFAARRWEFAPARSAGSAVAGEVILHYLFSGVPRVNGTQTLAAR